MTRTRKCLECRQRPVWQPRALKCFECIRARYNAMRERRKAHSIPESTRQEVRARSNGLCVYCGRPGSEVDHIIPIIRGGTSDIGNLAWSCRPCNRSKGDRGRPPHG